MRRASNRQRESNMGASTFDASRKSNAASTSASAGGVRNPAWFPEPSVAPWPPWSGGLDTAPEAIGAAYGFDRRAAGRVDGRSEWSSANRAVSCAWIRMALHRMPGVVGVLARAPANARGAVDPETISVCCTGSARKGRFLPGRRNATTAIRALRNRSAPEALRRRRLVA